MIFSSVHPGTRRGTSVREQKEGTHESSTCPCPTDEFGRPLVSDLDHWWERLGDRAKYAFEALERQTLLELAMAVELLTRDGEARIRGQHLARAVTPLRVRRLKVADALRARAAALHRTVADNSAPLTPAQDRRAGEDVRCPVLRSEPNSYSPSTD